MEDKEQERRESFDDFPNGVCMISMDGAERILYANREMARMYHAEGESSFCQAFHSFRGMVHPDDYTPLSVLYEQKEGHGYRYFNFRMKTEEGHFRRLEGVLGIYEDRGFGKVWLLSLINSHLKDEVMEQDDLTGLMGRHAFYQEAMKAASSDKAEKSFGSQVPLYVNLTNFKMYNSRLGIRAGDALLRKVAELLKKYFSQALMAHLSADNFVLLAPRENLESSLQKLAADVRDYAGDRSLAVKVGMVFFRDEGDQTLSQVRNAFDLAKIASDSIKRDASRVYAAYDEAMGKELEDRTYVLRHFDEALQKGLIEVYYQPVVRALTGKVCSVEALARWNDPEKGTLLPSLFIPVLEEARLIPRLDSYIIEETARLYVKLKKTGRPILPVSVNLSRVDFDVMEPFRYVEHVVEKYELPRSYFRIEVTESALTLDTGRLKREIGRFRDAGYECWLDDFGSGYSSLNVLQNFHFDELKMDMAFQQKENEQSRKIIRSILLMAKTLGVHTLAEGVETKEQVDFLRNAGCEKIQGFYYSRPLPYEKLCLLMKEKNLLPETAREEAVMEQAGLLNVMTGMPLSIFLDDGRKITVLMENRTFRETMKVPMPERQSPVGRSLESSDSPDLLKFRALVDRAVASGKDESMVYVDHGQYMKCRVRILAGLKGLYAGVCEVYDMSTDDGVEDSSDGLDGMFRNMTLLYDSIYLYHAHSDRVEIIGTKRSFLHPGNTMTWEEWLSLRKYIHQEDRGRFLNFMDRSRLYKTMKQSGQSSATDIFRIRKSDGSYGWQEVNTLSPEEKGDILICFKEAPLEKTAHPKETAALLASSCGLSLNGEEKELVMKGRVLEAMEKSEDIKFFWKDEKRRFLGASRAFLSCYDIREEGDLVGKTDEDMGWHVNNEPFRDTEEKILQEGFISRKEKGECIIRGRIHRIEASKRPVYDGNRICGLVGYFADREDDSTEKLDEKLGITDRETGLLGYRGMLMNGLSYYDNYRMHGEDYIGIALHIPAFEENVRLYGASFQKELLDRLISIILTFCPYKETLAYLGSGRFLILIKYAASYRVRSRLLDMSNAIHRIHEIQGRPVTLYLQYAMAYGSEAGSPDAFFHMLSSRLEEAEKERYGESAYAGDRITFDRETFDTSDEGVIITDFNSYDLLYVNQKTLEDLGLPADFDYTGQKCYRFLCGNEEPCEECPRSLLRRDRFFTVLSHNKKIGRNFLIHHTLVPFEGRRCHFEAAADMGQFTRQDRKSSELLFKEAAVNDAIELGMREPNPSDGIQRMLARIGQILESEKACIFEEMPDGTVRNTYEWCRQGTASTKALLQKMPRDDVQCIYDHFGPDQIAIVEDVSSFMKKYGSRSCYMPGLRSFISGHLIIAGKSMGYTEIVNPSPQILKEASPLLATLTRFLAIMMRNRDTVKRLNDWSYRDQLTGVKNRRAFLNFAHTLPENTTWAFLFGDMNGLKIINDCQGHEAGDHALSSAAGRMAALAGRDHVFRVGGDEFILALEEGNPEIVNAMARQLKQGFQSDGISMALGYAIRTAPIRDIDALITEADRNMYMDKKHPRK
ncbi:EAL domain-containing protein [Dialister sp.]|uniref:EAL domain-containing protein n=1 Tax=Dialister sp. TaxID=1955814 RepID=UPI003F12495F